MSTFITGRTLDPDGEPIPDTGFEVETGSWLAEQIRDRTGPISSHPTRPIWGVPVSEPDEPIRTVSIVGPEYRGPPPHYHKQSREAFSVRAGQLTLELDGTDHTVSEGESKAVGTGVTHTFSNEGPGRALVVTEIESPGRLRQVLPTLGGLAHDPKRDPEDPLQQAVIASKLSDNTVFTAAEGGLAGVASSLLAPVGEAAGYQAAYGEYLQPAFWRRHVEQPTAAELSDAPRAAPTE